MIENIEKDKLNLLFAYDKTLSRFDIANIIGCNDAMARKYKAIVDNIHLIEKPNVKELDVKTYAVSGCWHVPFHNQTLYAGFKNLLKDINVDGFILGGDFLDMASLGEYEKGKLSHTGVTLEDEYTEGNIVLDEIDKILGQNKDKVYLFGNHTNRYLKWKSDVNNSKYGELLSPVAALQLEERGYKVFSDYQNDYYELGSLQIFHGFYFNVHAAKMHLDKLRRNCMFFHTHRFQVYREGDFAAWNMGLMANINAPCFSYATRAMRESWANGFALVHVWGKHFFVEPINVVDSHFIYGGRKY